MSKLEFWHSVTQFACNCVGWYIPQLESGIVILKWLIQQLAQSAYLIASHGKAKILNDHFTTVFTPDINDENLPTIEGSPSLQTLAQL